MVAVKQGNLMSRLKVPDAKESHVIQLPDFSTIGDIPGKRIRLVRSKNNRRLVAT